MRAILITWVALQLAGCSGGGPSGDAGAGQSGTSADGGAAASGGGAARSGGGAATSGGGAATSGGGPGSAGGGAGDSCSTPGATRSCCEKGTQTCGPTVEFAIWGPCLDTDGAPLDCDLHTPGGCGADEFGPNCDGGTSLDAGPVCSVGAFGPQCPDASMPPMPDSCTDNDRNNEPEILAGYSPAAGDSVGKNGQIKVWITDEHAMYIAPGEETDPVTGLITVPGDRTAKAPDGYLFEPAVYIAPETAENGGTPHFPQRIKGQYNNDPTQGRNGPKIQGAPVDPPPAGINLSEDYDGEDVWEVNSLGLSPGMYIAQFVVADGDDDRAIGCITIEIAP